MSATVEDLMRPNVICLEPHHTFGHAKKILSHNAINSLPVVNSDKEVVGMISATDLMDDHPEGSPVNRYMTEKVYTIPQYEKIEIAARMMRNHKIHHLVVTHEKKLVGIISSFDLLKLTEGHRFVEKTAPTSSKHQGKRRKSEGNY